MKRLPRGVTWLALSLVVALCVGSGCLKRDGCPEVQAGLSRISHAGNDATEFMLADIVPFPWDRFYIFGSYTTSDEIRAASGLSHRGVSEGFELTVFSNTGEVRCYFEHSWEERKTRGWLFEGWDKGVYARGTSPEKARFTIRRQGDVAHFAPIEGATK